MIRLFFMQKEKTRQRTGLQKGERNIYEEIAG